jgi:hypothetical protein
LEDKFCFMRYTLIALAIVLNSVNASAQKDIFWADGGMSLARFLPGASMTYNYNVFRFLGLGAGVQLYDFHATMTNFQPVPALFWDLRFNIRSRKKNQYFLFMDAGLDIYRHNTEYWKDGNSVYAVRNDNGSYSGLGIGYFRPKTERGWGHYVSLKMISNHYSTNAYNFVTGEKSVSGWSGATLVVSFGYKF